MKLKKYLPSFRVFYVGMLFGIVTYTFFVDDERKLVIAHFLAALAFFECVFLKIWKGTTDKRLNDERERLMSASRRVYALETQVEKIQRQLAVQRITCFVCHRELPVGVPIQPCVDNGVRVYRHMQCHKEIS